MFLAALWSRCNTSLHFGHWCVRVLQLFLTSVPHPEQSCDVYCGGTPHHRDTVQLAVIDQPRPELRPGRVADRLGQVVIPDHVAHLQVFKDDQVVRLDQRPRRLNGEVFTLPLHLQMLPC